MSSEDPRPVPPVKRKGYYKRQIQLEAERQGLTPEEYGVYKGSTGSVIKPVNSAGGLLFLSNGPNVEAWDAATGKGLWYSQIGGLSSPAETFMLDGKQHMLFTGAAGLYLFVLN